MSVRVRRVILVGVVVAAAGAVPAAAFASGSASPSKSAVAGRCAPAAAKSARAAAKPAPAAPNPAAAAAKAAAARSGSAGSSITSPAAVAALAGRLGVSTGAALHALQEFSALSRQGRVNPAGPAFASIARGLGVSPAQLAAALGGVKQVLAGK